MRYRRGTNRNVSVCLRTPALSKAFDGPAHQHVPSARAIASIVQGTLPRRSDHETRTTELETCTGRRAASWVRLRANDQANPANAGQRKRRPRTVVRVPSSEYGRPRTVVRVPSTSA